jgi:hypothetical protein
MGEVMFVHALAISQADRALRSPSHRVNQEDDEPRLIEPLAESMQTSPANEAPNVRWISGRNQDRATTNDR